jgi:hypothetical protein
MFPVNETNDQQQQQQHLVDEVEVGEHPQHDARSYYDPGPVFFILRISRLICLIKFQKRL